MLDPRPVFYVIGLLVLGLGAAMAAPAVVEVAYGSEDWRVFALSGAITIFFGGAMTGACREQRSAGLSLQQSFLLTTSAWLALPIFGALPFMLGEPNARFVDAFFEAMSGITTTGSSVFTGLETLPKGVLLWRGMLQWFGGIGFLVFAMVFLPTMRVGGMQFFKSEAFDTLGKILPRAVEIAQSIGWIYLVLTGLCMFAYAAVGMSAFDATVHAMTTIATGGFSNNDASFGAYAPGAEYVGSFFMLLAALPFVRFVQLAAGSARPLFVDPQVKAFLCLVAVVAGVLTLFLVIEAGGFRESNLREALFNAVSILTGTGYASVDYQNWGAFPVTVIFILGFIGGCSGSTSCSIKIFRFQILAAALTTQIRLLHSPNGVFTPRYAGRPVPEDVITSVMSFLFFFLLSFGALAITLSMIGLEPITAISGAASAIANIGPGLGPEIGPAGNFAGLPDSAKWVLSFAMLLGRLELLTVLVLFTSAFWRG
ncbi:TrkH family potassium uptake protein [Pikeienuella piscinae]|uniref:Trk system potassium uptake protein n=1 Tax=Pikeienuella piscinae TaxID=2748098 RepID=A0A7M3T6T5_9RHOB|nr:TrkH family potassium uptake protein [Pikeienuella piscinae]QIE57716.1 TrkH family potassium uptake protein [Pikeienuella piscinae]